MARRKLSSLTEQEERFYRAAQRLYRRNVDWWDFHEFAFGMYSPIYKAAHAQKDVLGTPLYEELKSMWLELGVKQGMVRDDRARRS